MTQGGLRNRSGPPPDPMSARAEKRGTRLTHLPSYCYDGPVPDWPLPWPTPRELDLWLEAWTWPQAWGWSRPEFVARVHTVAQWVRVAVRAEAHDAPATVLASVHRFADQVGLTTAGLGELGWVIDSAPTASTAPVAPPPTSTARNRLKVIRPPDQATG